MQGRGVEGGGWRSGGVEGAGQRGGGVEGDPIAPLRRSTIAPPPLPGLVPTTCANPFLSYSPLYYTPTSKSPTLIFARETRQKPANSAQKCGRKGQRWPRPHGFFLFFKCKHPIQASGVRGSGSGVGVRLSGLVFGVWVDGQRLKLMVKSFGLRASPHPVRNVALEIIT